MRTKRIESVKVAIEKAKLPHVAKLLPRKNRKKILLAKTNPQKKKVKQNPKLKAKLEPTLLKPKWLQKP